MTALGHDGSPRLRSVPTQSRGPGPSVLFPLTVTTRRHIRSLVVHVAGEVDLQTAPRVARSLDHAVGERPPLLVVDLSQVGFLGCAGLSVLVAAHHRAGRRTCLRVVATRRVIRRPLHLTGLDQHLAVYDCLDTALAEPVSTGDTDG